MGVPPANRIPRDSSNSSDRSSETDRGKPKKDFHLPKKKEKGEGQGDKKGLFDLLKKEKEQQMPAGVMQDQQQQFAQMMEGKAAQAITEVQAKEAMTKISEIIQKMVSQLQAGLIGGGAVATMTLKGRADVPNFFANATLSLEQKENGIAIHFSNFETPQQQAAAIRAVEMQKDQLTQLMLNLQQKNIHVVEMQIGDQSISLPKIQPLPSPFEASSPETRAQSDQKGREEKGREDEEPS